MSTINAKETIVVDSSYNFIVDGTPYASPIIYPVTIVNLDPSSGNIVVTFNNNITYNSATNYFICGSNNISFDGSNNSITSIALYNISGWLGLIQNNGGKYYIRIQNIGITANGSTNLYYDSSSGSGSGYLTQSGFGSGSTAQNNIINNCYSTGPISNNSGGICGSSTSVNGQLTITNCYSTGSIDQYGGGICGRWSGSGITQANASNEILIIQNCYSTGEISGLGAGGIIGSYSGAGVGGNCLINNCYSIGNITGGEAGGITGSSFGSTSGIVTISSCYSIGDIGTSTNVAGGITGSNTGYNSGPISIINCYSTGNIFNNSFGIVAGNIGGTSVSITNSYCLNGSLIDTSGTILYCYQANGIWTDALANTDLSSNTVPPNQYTQGTVWTSVQVDTPYLLSSFNNIRTYNPNKDAIYSTNGTTYNSSAGVFTAPYTYNLLSVNNTVPPSSPSISINSVSGILTFVDLTYTATQNQYYVENVFATLISNNSYYGYNFNTFTLILLDSVITSPSTIYINNTQYSLNGTNYFDLPTFPIIIKNSAPTSGTLTVYFSQGITYSDSNKYFICGTDNITFDGSNNLVTLSNAYYWNGLIQNGTPGVNGKNNIKIKNLGIYTSLNDRYWTILYGAGFITQPYFGCNSSGIEIDNCYSDTPIICGNAGGIMGGYTTNCSGLIIKNCYSTGKNYGGGGIIASYNRVTNVTGMTIENCYSTGDMVTGGSGGIVGGFCYGITIKNCYSKGNIYQEGWDRPEEQGGIVGLIFGGPYFDVPSVIENCYSLGSISCKTCGGIVGSTYNDGLYNPTDITIKNCYSLGDINNTSGGIIGMYCYGTVNIINCYSAGIISNVGFGFVAYFPFGYPSPYTGLNISNSYCLYSTFTPSEYYGTITDCYQANGTWTDTLANTDLSSNTVPQNQYTQGTVWTSVQSNTPYLLSQFNTTQTYNPNTANLTSNATSFTSPNGVFTTPYAYDLLSINSAEPSTNNPAITINSISGAITFSDPTGIPQTTYAANVFSSLTKTSSTNSTNFYSYNFSDFTLLPKIVCFKEGTKILTIKGYIPIQELRKGDLIKTLCHSFVPIHMISKKEIYHPSINERVKDQLYKCSNQHFNEVFEDLIITGCHSILVDNFKDDYQREKTKETLGKIYATDNKYRIPACVDDRTTVYEIPGTYTVYHMALENDNYFMNYGIYANGLVVETCSKRYLTELSNMNII